VSAADLLATQQALQAEADEVYAELGLAEALPRIGEPHRVGSSALGLMVRRDLDVTVVCDALGAAALDAVAALGARLLRHPQVQQVQLRDDTGRWNTDPRYPDGLYIGVGCHSQRGEAWTLDLWFVDEPDRQPDLAHRKTLPPQLDRESRVAILRIKAALADRPPRGFDVYTAVLDDGVRTVEGFEEWRAGR
jgi:hypothetical protein